MPWSVPCPRATLQRATVARALGRGWDGKSKRHAESDGGVETTVYDAAAAAAVVAAAGAVARRCPYPITKHPTESRGVTGSGTGRIPTQREIINSFEFLPVPGPAWSDIENNNHSPVPFFWPPLPVIHSSLLCFLSFSLPDQPGNRSIDQSESNCLVPSSALASLPRKIYSPATKSKTAGGRAFPVQSNKQGRKRGLLTNTKTQTKKTDSTASVGAPSRRRCKVDGAHWVKK